MNDSALPPDLRDWIEATTGATVARSHRHLAGASRQAWSVDVEHDGELLPLFVLRDSLSGNGGSARDGAVLAALAGTTVPVPRVHGVDEQRGALLLEQVEATSRASTTTPNANQQLAT